MIELRYYRFRWAACQIDALENYLNYPEPQRALSSLPDTVDVTYARILSAIPSRHRESAIAIVQILAFSERPLRLEEAVEAIAVDPKGNPRFDPRNRMPEPREISRYCLSLVVVVDRSDSEYDHVSAMELQLAHFSVKEYLMSNRLEKGYTDCFQDIRENFPLAQYCAG